MTATSTISGIPDQATSIDGSELLEIEQSGVSKKSPISLAFQFYGAQVVNVKAFGAVGDGITDDTAAIQAAINFAIYLCPPILSGYRMVYLPEPNYLTSDTLQLGYGLGFTSITLQGSGPRFDATQKNQSGTCILSTMRDRPALNIQGARMTRVKGISFSGPYDYVSRLGLGYAFIDDDHLIGTWQDPLWDATAFSAHAPHACITIDAYSGTPTADTYPAVTYPAFLGTGIPQYGKGFSSSVVLEDVVIRGYYVGVCSPGYANDNGEFIHFTEGLISGCVLGLSWGESQHRLHKADSINFDAVFTAISNVHVGNQIGHLHGEYTNCHFGGVINLVEGNSSWGGPLTFRSCYGEVVRGIGNYSATGNSLPFTMDGCEFTLRECADERYGIPLSHFTGADAKLALVGGTSIRTVSGLIVKGAGVTPSIKLDGFTSIINDISLYPEPFYEGTCGVLSLSTPVQAIENFWGEGQFHKAHGGDWNIVPYFQQRIRFENGQITSMGVAPEFPVRTASSLVFQGTQFTLEDRVGRFVTMPTDRYAYAPGAGWQMDLGDCINIEGAWFVVVGIVADKCRLRQISGFRLAMDGTTFINMSDSDMVNAQVLGYALNRFYTPNNLMGGAFADTAYGATSVKEVMQDAEQWTIASDIIEVGDTVFLPDEDLFNVGGNSNYRDLPLTAMDEGAKTMTFSRNWPRVAKSQVLMPLWLKDLSAPVVTASPGTGSFFVGSPPTITLSSSTRFTDVFYTEDGTDPTPSSTLYAAPFAIPDATAGVSRTLKVLGEAPLRPASAIATFVYTAVTPPSDPDAAAWAAAVTSNGGAFSGASVAALNTFIIALKGAGLWAGLSLFGPMQGNDLAAVVIQYKNGSWGPATNVGFVGADYVEATGLDPGASNTSKYLQTGFTLAGHLTPQNTMLAVYDMQSANGQGGCHMGSLNGSLEIDVFAPYSDGAVYGAQYDQLSLTGGATTYPMGLVMDCRESDVLHKAYKNGVLLSTSTHLDGTSSFAGFFAPYVFARNNAGTADFFVSCPIGGYFMGAALTATQAASFYTIEQARQTALGRAV